MNTSTSNLPTNEPSPSVGRISRNAFEPLIGVFYGLAVLGALTRLVLQLKFYRRLQLDDYILIFACVCLTASTVLCYVFVGDLYWNQQLNYNPSLMLDLMQERVGVTARINTYQKAYDSSTSLLWTVIFAIKFAYLAFFRRLVDRIRPLVIYWRIVVGFCAVSFPIGIISIYISCSEKNQGAATYVRPSILSLAYALTITDVAVDVATDLLIVVIPIYLLWSVRIKLHQKLIIGIFLSLNLVMTFTAVVRRTGLKYHGTIDTIWLFTWHHIEACVAVIMISITAFRSIYVSSQKTSRARKQAANNNENKPWYSDPVAAIRRKRALDRKDGEFIAGLPTIPSATLTGLLTFIRGERRTGTGLQSTTSTTNGKEEA